MATKIFDKFWVTVSAIIALGLLIYLFPLLLDKYGLAKAVLFSLLVPFAVGLAYLRGYWVSTWLSERRRKHDEEADS